jgi:hypothetical protein
LAENHYAEADAEPAAPDVAAEAEAVVEAEAVLEAEPEAIVEAETEPVPAPEAMPLPSEAPPPPLLARVKAALARTDAQLAQWAGGNTQFEATRFMMNGQFNALRAVARMAEVALRADGAVA